MGKVVILTDSSSGIRQAEAQQLGISVLPMPFFINGETLFEDINLTQDTFYEHLTDGAEISTSMPAVGDLTDRWDELLKEYDEIVYIPLSSGLSSSCETATALSSDEEYEGKVFVVNNQRISVTQKQSVFDAIRLAESGKSGKEIKDILEDAKFQSSIYIMVDTLYYLKKGGRITPAVAMLGNLLKIVPVMKLNYELGGKIDSLDKVRTVKKANLRIIEHMVDECKVNNHDYIFAIEHVLAEELAQTMKQVLIDKIGECQIVVRELPSVVGAHMGVGGIGYQYIRKYEGVSWNE